MCKEKTIKVLEEAKKQVKNGIMIHYTRKDVLNFLNSLISKEEEK